tara:strand:+ start:318 stop:683 length:366 start_codon:yes stop_codon:yes gene_type:complete
MKEVFINSRNKINGIYNGGVLNFANQKNNIRSLKRPTPFIFSIKNISNTLHVNSIEIPLTHNSNISVPITTNIINKEEIFDTQPISNIKRSKITNIQDKINKLVHKKPSITHRGEGFLIKE